MSPSGKMNENLDFLSDEVSQLSLKSSSINNILKSNGENFREWRYDVDNFADTIKYGREILSGEKITKSN